VRTVWLASYPKSGNTWLRAVATAWVVPGPVDVNALAGPPIASYREYFDAALGIPSSSLTFEEVDRLRPYVDEQVASEAAAPHLRKIHDSYLSPVREPIVSSAATQAAVYIIRDPREVAVSLAHAAGRSFAWAQRRLNDPEAALAGSGDQLHEQLRQWLGTWSQHVRSWVDESPFTVEVVRYEDLASAPVETFGRALRFAGFAGVTDRRVAECVERAAFARLERAEREHGFRERRSAEAPFFRRGESGSWRVELSGDLADRIRDDHREVMSRFGYD
jgi:hypothetical protein